MEIPPGPSPARSRSTRRSGTAEDPHPAPGVGSRRHPRTDETPAEARGVGGRGLLGRTYLAKTPRRRAHRATATAATVAEAAWPGRPGTAGWTPLRLKPQRPWRAERPPLPSLAAEPPRARPYRARPRPCRAQPRPRSTHGTFPGVPRNRGPRSPAPCGGDPGRTPPSRPPRRGRELLGPP